LAPGMPAHSLASLHIRIVHHMNIQAARSLT